MEVSKADKEAKAAEEKQEIQKAALKKEEARKALEAAQEAAKKAKEEEDRRAMRPDGTMHKNG